MEAVSIRQSPGRAGRYIMSVYAISRNEVAKRRGFALLSVVLISAVLVAAAFMFTAQMMTESHITKTDALFKSALSQTEAGLSNSLALIRVGKSPDSTSWAQHFANSDTVVLTGTQSVSGTRGAYTVAVSVATSPSSDAPVLVSTEHSTDGKTIEHWKGNVDLVATGAVYPPSVSTMLSGSSLSAGYSARRSIKTRTQAYWTKTTDILGGSNPKVTPTDFPLKYGVYTAGDLSIKGASKEWHGDVFANGDVYVQKTGSIVGGEAFAGGSVTGNPPGVPHPNQTPIPFPEIDTAYFKTMAKAYIDGTYPYNALNNQIPGTGTDPVTNPIAYYTCTNPLVAGNKRAYYHVDSLASSSDPFHPNQAYFLDPTAVYYNDGPMHLNGGALQGTIVINGDAFINGNVTVATGQKLPTLLVTGNITKENGCSEIQGVVYTGGTFTGRGTATITGALIARGSVDMSGTMDVYYDTNLSTISTGGTVDPGGSGVPSVNYDLTQLVLPSFPDGRIWQEVNPS
jgi:hypothetical protein